MLNNFITKIILINCLLSFSIFDTIEDYKIPSSTYTASANLDNLYNFTNPACNSLIQNSYINTQMSNYFDGILNSHSIFFSLNTKNFKKLNISIINNSITDLNNTTNAWYDNGDGIIDVNEIDYNNISNFSHNSLGMILTKSFQLNTSNLPYLKNSYIKYGINSKLSFSSILSEKSISHAFDVGILYVNANYFNSSFAPNIGIVLKDILPFKYWTTNRYETKKTSIIIGTSINISNILGNQKSESLINTDINIMKLNYSSIGFEHKIKSNKNQLSLNCNFSQIESSVGFLARMNKKIDIAYIFIIPTENSLNFSQKINIGINKDFIRKKI
tara:strand:- start:8715 stop:9704 length:990 start_codon:yes stop_codon:yes gene_type:complete